MPGPAIRLHRTYPYPAALGPLPGQSLPKDKVSCNRKRRHHLFELVFPVRVGIDDLHKRLDHDYPGKDPSMISMSGNSLFITLAYLGALGVRAKAADELAHLHCEF